MNVGVLGGGQLGRMLGLAGQPLGFSFVFLDPAEECPAAAAGAWIRAGFDDTSALRELAERSDVVTYEFENVPVAAVHAIAEQRSVLPPATSLEASQDRLREKEFFTRLGIATPRFEAVEGQASLARAVERIGLPAVLKTRRLGYDGRGQRVLRDARDLSPALAALGEWPLLLEALVPFERELSLLAVRARSGECAFYPLVENHHREGILRLSLAPAPGLVPALQARAEDCARRAMEALGHVGVLALELFQCDDELLANELAPRVHNSGHWTIEGAATSQFENHLRAIAGLSLGSTAVRGHWAMVNLIGEVRDLGAVSGAPGTHVHLYGKRPRPLRKLGHITLCADDAETLARRVEALWRMLGEAAGPMPECGGRRPGTTSLLA